MPPSWPHVWAEGGGICLTVHSAAEKESWRHSVYLGELEGRSGFLPESYRGPSTLEGSTPDTQDMSFSRRKGFYKQEVNKTVWELPKRYVSISPVGSGAYGCVW